MKIKLIALLLLLGSTPLFAQLYFPPKVGTQWNTISPTSLGWCLDKLDSLDTFLADKNTKGFLILKDGKIAHEKYFGTFTQDSLWYWASAGKSLFAFLMGQAQELGALKLTDTASSYLGNGWTSCTAAQEEKITIQHMMSMTSGLKDNVLSPDCTLPICLKYEADAGTRWAYHNAPYTLSHKVLENATSTTLNQFTIQNLTQPTGLVGLWFMFGSNEIFGSRLRDMARFGLLIQNHGIWDGDTLLADTVYFNAMINSSQSINESYGYLWWLNGKSKFMLPGSQLVFNGPLIPNAPADTWCALGKNDQKLYVSQSQGLVVVRMGNDAGIPGLAPTLFDNELWNKLNQVFCNATSAQESEIEMQIKVWASSDEAAIKLKSTENLTFEIYSVSGALITEGRLVDTEIKTIRVQPGFYIVRATNGKSISSFRISVL